MLIDDVNIKGDNFPSRKEETSTFEECQRLSNFFEMRKVEIENLKEEIQFKKGEPLVRGENIQKLVEELQIKSEEYKKVAEG